MYIYIFIYIYISSPWPGGNLFFSVRIDLSAELDLQTEHGTTALMLAARRPELEGVKRLLEAKANPNLSNKARLLDSESERGVAKKEDGVCVAYM